MISKNDLVLLLTDLEERGIDIGDSIVRLMSSRTIPLDILSLINKNRPMDITNFYERLRKNYNDKRSNLYKNIMKEVDGTDEVLTTLSSLNLQILLYAKHVDNKNMFLKNARAEEIVSVLKKYYSTYDLSDAMKLMKLIKADIVVLETSTGRREQQ